MVEEVPSLEVVAEEEVEWEGSKSRVIPISFPNLDLSVRVVVQVCLVVMGVELVGWVVVGLLHQ